MTTLDRYVHLVSEPCISGISFELAFHPHWIKKFVSLLSEFPKFWISKCSKRLKGRAVFMNANIRITRFALPHHPITGTVNGGAVNQLRRLSAVGTIDPSDLLHFCLMFHTSHAIFRSSAVQRFARFGKLMSSMTRLGLSHSSNSSMT